MDETITALTTHLNNRVDKYGVQTVKLYAGEFGDANKIDAMLPAVLIVPPVLETVRGLYQMDFSLLVVSETLHYGRESNAQNNLLLGWRIYHYLKNFPTFSADGYTYVVGVKDDTRPLTARIAAFTWRHVVAEIEMTIWKQTNV